jgi:hypothetical protein
MTYPVRYMAVLEVNQPSPFEAEVLDTLDNGTRIPLCLCFCMRDALNIARAMNIVEGCRVE